MQPIVDDNNFFYISAWMISKLKLKGIKLLIFAMIYSYTINNQEYYASQEYLATWFDVTVQSISNYLKWLTENNLIKKTAIETKGFIDMYSYTVNLDTLASLGIKIQKFK